MAKLVRSYRISAEVDILIKAEAERLSSERGKKIAEADVIELAVVAWLSGVERNTVTEAVAEDRRKSAEAAMRSAETASASAPLRIHRQAESVAQRKAREAKEHAEKLAECGTVRVQLPCGGFAVVSKDVKAETLSALNEMLLAASKQFLELTTERGSARQGPVVGNSAAGLGHNSIRQGEKGK